MAMASKHGNGGPLPPHILVFPYPAQGHMIPLLDLAHHLSLRGLSVTILLTPANLPLLRPLLSRAPTIKTLVLPFPTHPSLPAGAENTKDLPPELFLPMMHALASLHDPLLKWARTTPSPPDAIVSDFFLGWTQRVAAELGIPRLVFCPSGALTLSVTHTLWREMPKQSSPVAFPGIPGSPVYPWHHLSSLYRKCREDDSACEFVRRGFLDNTASWGYVFNTFAALEAPYLRHLQDELGHPRVWAVGPLVPPGGGGGDRFGDSAEVLRWLDACPAASVVYVCFGSQAVLSRRQAEALGAALERSGARFVWCLREGFGAAAAAEGLEEKAEGRGLVVRGWAPQVGILSHAAVGAFLTHCGWNSVMEGVAAGVAMLAWPMSADQFMTARLLVEEAGVGVRACEGGPDAVPDPEELARVVAASVGDAVRPRAAEAARLRREALAAVGEGGSSSRDLHGLVAAMFQLKSWLGGHVPVEILAWWPPCSR